MNHLKCSKYGLLMVFFSSCIALAADENSSNAYKCWTDEDGITSCGNVVPKEYSQRGFQEYNDQGIIVNKVQKAKSDEEIAAIRRKEEEAEKKKKQDAEDRALLDLFGTEQDIERARSAILATIDGQIHSIETIVASLEKNLSDMLKNLEDSKNNPDVSESQLQIIQKNIDDVNYRIKSNRDTLQSKQKEKENVNKEYDAYSQKFKDILNRRGGVLPEKEELGEKETGETPAPPAESVQ